MADMKWTRMTAMVNRDMAGTSPDLFKLVFQDGVRKYEFVMDISDARHLGKISRLLRWENFKLWLRHPIKMYRANFRS